MSQHSQYRGCHGFHCRETLQLKNSGVSGTRVTGNNFTVWSNARLLGSLGVLVSLSFHKACKTHTNSFLGTMWMRFRSPFFHDWDSWHVMIFIAKGPFSALHQMLLGTSPSPAPQHPTVDEKMAVTRPPTGVSSSLHWQDILRLLL